MIEGRLGIIGHGMTYGALGANKEGKMEELTMKQECTGLRSDIQSLKIKIADLHDHGSFKGPDMRLACGECPDSQKANMHANITLAFRQLEDARMRLGKVIQAAMGGVSIYDEA